MWKHVYHHAVVDFSYLQRQPSHIGSNNLALHPSKSILYLLVH